jgi:hypothetical protein
LTELFVGGTISFQHVLLSNKQLMIGCHQFGIPIVVVKPNECEYGGRRG